MESFTIRLAGQYFTICPVCDYIKEYCKDYIEADVKRGAATETNGIKLRLIMREVCIFFRY